ncbi:molybdenum cofactor guanylyltransferase [Aquimarina litoralis]|uniref:molybdenum cofactor guanylyltransferase n=1 Tax=Aquimarina litoralis TaxID=584605 RepID=UPI001C55C5CA|nr:molybdenum cofactor guanylyltransferase [Aquimarina litoralis]MBW1297675.1 NTP transferase domain-containing protein [Aquimarina litoralis]
MILWSDLDITGIVLAGGKSSRMGYDKGLKLHLGKPFISHIIKALETITKKIIIITSNKEYEIFGYPCMPDIIPNLGPVGGIYTGLKSTKTSQNLVLSCDIPFINDTVLFRLVSAYESNYDVISYEENPLISLYNTSVIDTFYESIQKRRLSLFKTIASLKVKNVPVENDIKPFIRNINTQQQYKEAIQ